MTQENFNENKKSVLHNKEIDSWLSAVDKLSKSIEDLRRAKEKFKEKISSIKGVHSRPSKPAKKDSSKEEKETVNPKKDSIEDATEEKSSPEGKPAKSKGTKNKEAKSKEVKPARPKKKNSKEEPESDEPSV